MTVRCRTASAGAEVAAQVVLVMATRAGITPVAADRLRGDIAAAMGAFDGGVEVACAVGEDAVTVTILAEDEALAQMARALEAHRPDASGGRLVLRVRRTQLRAV